MNLMIYNAVNYTARKTAESLTDFDNLDFVDQLEIMQSAMEAAEQHYIYDWIQPVEVFLIWLALLLIWIICKAVKRETQKVKVLN